MWISDSCDGDFRFYSSYTQSKTLKDKLTLYMLVVALSVNGFSADVSEIATDFKKSAVAYVPAHFICVMSFLLDGKPFD
jgi:hypothetical protein